MKSKKRKILLTGYAPDALGVTVCDANRSDGKAGVEISLCRFRDLKMCRTYHRCLDAFKDGAKALATCKKRTFKILIEEE